VKMLRPYGCRVTFGDIMLNGWLLRLNVAGSTSAPGDRLSKSDRVLAASRNSIRNALYPSRFPFPRLLNNRE
jgi:hypothetical protein